MRRVNNLYTAVIAFDNLYAAYRRALKGNEGKMPGLRFFFHAENEIIRLHRELADGSYMPGDYHYFTCFEPKERIIAVAPFRDRVVHHAIVGVLNPIYEKIFISDSYATRKNMGVHKAIERAQYFIRRNAWYLKSDILKYFNSVDHKVLLKLFARKIKDNRLLDLLDKITVNGGSEGRGIPIGNQTSQFFSNIYLDQLDHFLKEKNACGATFGIWTTSSYFRTIRKNC
jgi:RNA-directed DNA polymerase